MQRPTNEKKDKAEVNNGRKGRADQIHSSRCCAGHITTSLNAPPNCPSLSESSPGQTIPGAPATSHPILQGCYATTRGLILPSRKPTESHTAQPKKAGEIPKVAVPPPSSNSDSATKNHRLSRLHHFAESPIRVVKVSPAVNCNLSQPPTPPTVKMSYNKAEKDFGEAPVRCAPAPAPTASPSPSQEACYSMPESRS